MANVVVSPTAPPFLAPDPHPRRRWMLISLAFGLALLIAGGIVLKINWPYRYRRIHPLLEDVLSSQVTIARYHRIYFPNPGFVAEGLTLRRKSAPQQPPLGTVQHMVVHGRWSDLFLLRQRVRVVEINGLRIHVPAIGSPANHRDFPPGSSSDFDGPETLIEELIIRQSELDIDRDRDGPLKFPIHKLELSNFVHGQPFHYSIDMLNAIPTGEIQSTGSLGPIDAKGMAGTPLSGHFTFTSVKLADVGEISGILASSGEFHGTLGAIEASATSHTPDFSVEDGTPSSVDATIQCAINGINGDVTIHSIEARIGATGIQASGAIQGSPKATNLDIEVANGRVQDVMRPFLADQVPLTGPVWLRSHAYLAPSSPNQGFLHRLQVDGSFTVPSERMTDRDSERSLSDFSRRAQDRNDKAAEPDPGGAEPEPGGRTDVLSFMQGPARIRDGIASSENLIFRIPGADAHLVGTFNFHQKSVHLTGELRMQTDISHTTTGFKSFLLKPLAPFFKKKKAGAVIPIAVTGTPGHYQVTQDIVHGK